jgi:hypothetical protein
VFPTEIALAQCVYEPNSVLSAAPRRGAYLGRVQFAGPQRHYFPVSLETDEILGVLVPFVTPFVYGLSGILDVFEHYTIIINLAEKISTRGFYLSGQVSHTGGNELGRDIYLRFRGGGQYLLTSPTAIGYRPSELSQSVFDTAFGIQGRVVQILVRLFVHGIFDEGLGIGSNFEYKVDMPVFGPSLP